MRACGHGICVVVTAACRLVIVGLVGTFIVEKMERGWGLVGWWVGVVVVWRALAKLRVIGMAMHVGCGSGALGWLKSAGEDTRPG